MQRTQWALVVGRFLTPALAALALLGATVGDRLARLVFALVLAVNVYLAVPAGWSDVDLEAMGKLFVPLAAAVALGCELLLWLRRRDRPLVALLAAAAPLLVVVPYPLTEARSAFRHRVYAAAATPFAPDRRWARSFDVHGIHGEFVAAAPLWRHLDDGAPHRVAVTAGWDGFGHNWLRYPLLGSRLQNRLVYVPVTKDGDVIDYRLAAKVRERADERAWLERLVRAGVDHVVALPPYPLEDGWMRRAPGVFRLVARGLGDRARAYRFDRTAARRAVDGR